MATSSLKGSERLIKILLLLQSGKQVTVDGMADYFGVSRRTIFRDLQSLQKLDVPITWDVYDGYQLVYGSQLPTFVFTKKELAILMMGIEFMKAQVDKTMVDDAKSVELKIGSKLNGDLKSFLQKLDNKTVVSPYLKETSQKTGGDWYIIIESMQAQRAIQFVYTTKDGEKSNRQVDPLLIVYFTDHWNVFAYDRERKAIRSFILDQMSEVEQTGLPFKTIPDNYSDEELIYGSQSKERICVEVSENLAATFVRKLPTQKYELRAQQGGSVHVEFEHDLNFINHWLLQFGGQVSVIEPMALKLLRKNTLQEMLNA